MSEVQLYPVILAVKNLDGVGAAIAASSVLLFPSRTNCARRVRE
jgi:hypothetical protein